MPRLRTGPRYENVDEDVVVGSSQSSRFRRKARRRETFFCFGGLLILVFALAGVVAVLLVITLSTSEADCSVESGLRFNCIPEGGKTEAEDVCGKRGCCWSDSSTPKCFYPTDFGYTVNGKVVDTRTGKTANLTRKSGQPSQYGGDIDSLRVDMFYETPYRLHVKVGDVRKETSYPIYCAAICKPLPLLVAAVHLLIFSMAVLKDFPRAIPDMALWSELLQKCSTILVTSTVPSPPDL